MTNTTCIEILVVEILIILVYTKIQLGTGIGAMLRHIQTLIGNLENPVVKVKNTFIWVDLHPRSGTIYQSMLMGKRIRGLQRYPFHSSLLQTHHSVKGPAVPSPSRVLVEQQHRRLFRSNQVMIQLLQLTLTIQLLTLRSHLQQERLRKPSTFLQLKISK